MKQSGIFLWLLLSLFFAEMMTAGVPSEIPEVRIINNDDPGTGNIFCTLTGSSSSFLYAFDNYGTAVFYREIPQLAYNFQPHPGGKISYHDFDLDAYIILNSRYEPVDTYHMANGYMANMHEFDLQENGHALMLAYDYQNVDLRGIIEDGDSNALVIGYIVQELDSMKNLLFQWRSWDHLEISDTYERCKANFLGKLTICDFAHANSIYTDGDSSLVISARNTSEIIKIHRQTGKIIWRMGGKNNEFTFIGENKIFRGQHTVKKLENGNITMLDNGYGSDSLYSRGLEYQVDELEKTVRLVKEYIHSPPVYGYAMGNMQRMENDHTLIYWGVVPGDSSAPVSEYNREGELVFEANFNKIKLPSYRCYRSDWKPDIFSLSMDSLHFEQFQSGQVPVQSVEIKNNTGRVLLINKLLSHSGLFSLNEELPVSLDAGESKIILVRFDADTAGLYKDILTFCYDSNSSRVSVQLPVSAEVWLNSHLPTAAAPELKIFPNPFTSSVSISTDQPIQQLQIIDLNGRLVHQYTNPGKSSLLELESLATGIYILQVVYADQSLARSRIIKINPNLP